MLQQDRCSSQLERLQKIHQQFDSFREKIDFYEAELGRKNDQISKYRDICDDVIIEKDQLRKGNRDLAEHLLQVKDGAWKHLNSIETDIASLKEEQTKLECDLELHQNDIKIENMLSSENILGMQEAISQLKDDMVENDRKLNETNKAVHNTAADLNYLKTMVENLSVRQLQTIQTQGIIADKISRLTSQQHDLIAVDHEKRIGLARLLLSSATAGMSVPEYKTELENLEDIEKEMKREFSNFRGEMNRVLDVIMKQRDITHDATIAQSKELQNLQQKISCLQKNINAMKKEEINMKRQQTQFEFEMNVITANYEQKRTEQEDFINKAVEKINSFLETNRMNGEKLEDHNKRVKELKENIEHLHIKWDDNTDEVRIKTIIRSNYPVDFWGKI